MTDDALERLAARCGIDDRYRDSWGEWRKVSRTTRVAILEAFGYDASTPASCEEGLRRRLAEEWATPLPPVAVLRGPEARVTLAVPEPLQGRIAWRVAREDGETLAGDCALDALRVESGQSIDGRRFVRRVLDLPPLPFGYHRFSVDLPGGAGPAGTTLIVAPQRCHVPAALAGGQRVWGVSAQLYALRSGRNWGMGDFGDLRRLVETVAGAGGGVVGLNPLHGLFPGNPAHCSPYTPSSRLGLNVLYIDVEAVSDFAECAEAQAVAADAAFGEGLAQLRSVRLVDYPPVAAAKLRVLRLLHASFRERHLDRPAGPTARGRAFRAFQAGEGGRSHIAVFESLAEHFARDGIPNYHWRNWPEPFRDASAQAVARFAADNPSRIEFHQYLQWLAVEQLRACADRAAGCGMAVGLYVDLALGADPDGADAWALRGVLAEGAAAGAPPDVLNLKGQDWGFAPFHPDALRAAAYGPFIDMLRSTMRAAGAIRIDHVLGLRRLYWVPKGHPPSEGGYVRYPLEELLAVVALESVRNHCLVVGEDLGTLPEGFRDALHDAALLSYRVLSFERDADGAFHPPEAYPRLALVTAGTHDMATFPGFWRGDDLRLRESLDLFPSDAIRAAAFSDRPVERRRLIEALDRAGLAAEVKDDPAADGRDPSEALVAAVHSFLARTPAMLLLAQVEDLIGETEPTNVPGTGSEYPNWRRTLALPVERIAGDPRVRAAFALLAAERPAHRPAARQVRM